MAGHSRAVIVVAALELCPYTLPLLLVLVLFYSVMYQARLNGHPWTATVKMQETQSLKNEDRPYQYVQVLAKLTHKLNMHPMQKEHFFRALHVKNVGKD